jgi:hypothetical protein
MEIVMQHFQFKELNDRTAPIKSANPVRGTGVTTSGLSYRELAVSFAMKYPIGTVIALSEFDDFAISVGGIAPPVSTEKDSDGWLAFLQRRHQFKYSINKASTHPQMKLSYGVDPFLIETKGGAVTVLSPYEAATTPAVALASKSLLANHRTRLKYLMQSVDFSELPPAEQNLVVNLSMNMEQFQERMEFEASMLERNFARFRQSVIMLVDSGKITPSNGGIKALVAPDAEEENAE